MSPNATLQPSIPLSCPGLPPSPRLRRAEHPPEPRRSLGGAGTGASSTPRPVRSTTTASAYWIARSSRAMTPSVWERAPQTSRNCLTLRRFSRWL